MRRFAYSSLIVMLVALVGCVTINVYFPEAAAQKAADQFVGSVLDGTAPKTPTTDKKDAPATPPPGKQPSAMLLDLLVPAAQADEAPNLRVQTPAVQAIQARMRARFDSSLKALLDSGAVGFANDGTVAMRDAALLPLAQRAQANAVIADENRDRAALYREIANANNHPEWQAQIRAIFAKTWIDHAQPGWYYQNASGAWQRK